MDDFCWSFSLGRSVCLAWRSGMQQIRRQKWSTGSARVFVLWSQNQRAINIHMGDEVPEIFSKMRHSYFWFGGVSIVFSNNYTYINSGRKWNRWPWKNWVACHKRWSDIHWTGFFGGRVAEFPIKMIITHLLELWVANARHMTKCIWDIATI